MSRSDTDSGPEDVLQSLATEAYGRGSAISHDRHPQGGWKTTAWGPKGEAVEIVYDDTKPAARTSMANQLRAVIRDKAKVRA